MFLKQKNRFLVEVKMIIKYGLQIQLILKKVNTKKKLFAVPGAQMDKH